MRAIALAKPVAASKIATLCVCKTPLLVVMLKSSVKEKVVGSGVGVKVLVETPWVVPLSRPPCVIVPLLVPLPLLTVLKFPFAFWQPRNADADCDEENKPMVKATNANVANILIFKFIIFLL